MDLILSTWCWAMGRTLIPPPDGAPASPKARQAGKRSRPIVVGTEDDPQRLKQPD
ncbi:MAG: hypothetical protein H6661_09090 [Ardenticatenaceae bacterium]|nr:hypothetical protein [Ardenticatenaceae bacterium]